MLYKVKNRFLHFRLFSINHYLCIPNCDVTKMQRLVKQIKHEGVSSLSWWQQAPFVAMEKQEVFHRGILFSSFTGILLPCFFYATDIFYDILIPGIADW